MNSGAWRKEAGDRTGGHVLGKALRKVWGYDWRTEAGNRTGEQRLEIRL